ncbi:hypothetical protein [Novosphingobium sp. SG720]|uniref:DUF4760 domain-containing protein n=1 Tax=Novosphingobium sp. SG720 TaxID=2586998 RepID=UPI0014455DD5|nr:hypothetical protein [Novosphingobium sp. SG720]
MTFVLANPSVVVGAIGIAVTILLFWLGARRNRMEATFKAIEMMQAKEARNTRFNLQELLAPASTHSRSFGGLDSETRASVSSVATQFGFIGSLARRRRIYLNIYFESFASSVLINHDRLRDYAAWRKGFREITDGSLWQDFDWLAARAERFLLLRAQSSSRRWLIRFGLAGPNIDLLKQLSREARLGPKAALGDVSGAIALKPPNLDA